EREDHAASLRGRNDEGNLRLDRGVRSFIARGPGWSEEESRLRMRAGAVAGPVDRSPMSGGLCCCKGTLRHWGRCAAAGGAFPVCVDAGSVRRSVFIGNTPEAGGVVGFVGRARVDRVGRGLQWPRPGERVGLKHFLRERVTAGKCSVLLATHALDIVERYADRAALLLHGRIAHEWRKDELAAMRAKSEEGFEAALAAVAVEVEREDRP